ncbi:phenylacetate--CoA ligase family protein [Kitasatospora sp. NBC_00315]|uniref:phenylacetate--CoA ligase family protein n=1 Tax=Kitasatospora sp. NBC_00315 TaxID=2975963 RepID=UPI0032518E50
MFTLFDDKLDAFARQTLADHRRFDGGGWGAQELHERQFALLRETLRYVKEGSPFYREHLSALDDADIEALTPESLARIPFTTKDDLRRELHNMLSKPVSDAWIFYETTGTTGRATPCPRDNVDSLVNNTALTICYDEVFRQHGEDHVVGVMGPSELHSTGDTFGDVCRNLGHAVAKMWPRSPVIGTKRALEVMRELSISVVFCAPNVAISLAREAIEAGLDPRKDFGVRAFMFTGELATPGLLANIGSIWGATAYNCLYASQEASVLGAVHADGRLRTLPLNVLYEVVDPETGEAAPTHEGVREGELVLTHLYQGSKPLVRYRTGDMVRLSAAGEQDAYPSEVMLPLGRVRDLIDLNGHRVSAYELEHTVLSHTAGVLDYQITIDRVASVDTLAVKLEIPAGAPDGQEARAAALAEAAQLAWGCPLEVSYGRPGGVTATGAMVSWKAARVHDLRQSVVDPERQAALAIVAARGDR